MELNALIDRVRAAVPENRAHRWRLPPGAETEAALPAGLARLYRLSRAPRLGDVRFLDGDELGSPEEVADDFAEWRLRAAGDWFRVAKAAQTSVYENAESGEIAVHTADDLKEGRLRLRTLAPDMESFVSEVVLGPRYPLLAFDPAAEPAPSAEYDDWTPFLESIGLVDPAEAAALRERWAAEHAPPASTPPADTAATPARDEAVAEKLRLLGKVGTKVLVSSGALDSWDLDYLGFGYTKGAPPRRIPDASGDLVRLRRLVGTAHLGTLFLFTEEETVAETAALPEAFTETGLDPAGAADWFAVGDYHRRQALLLLHRETGAVAGLEPEPANRLRPLHDDIVEFLDAFGLGPRQRELSFDAADVQQDEAVEQWLAFLTACGIPAEGADDA